MAKLKVFSMFDVKTSNFHPPFVSHHTGEALRGWEDACNKLDTLPSKFPADFQLWELGLFDSSTGIYDAASPKLLATALEYKKKNPQDNLSGLDI